MFDVYILRSDSIGRFYIGSTEDLERRLAEHNANLAPATKNRGPWRLVYDEVHLTRSAAMRRERYFKTGRGREDLQRLLAGKAVSPIGRGRRGDTLNQ
jgi:putative endonuclease